MTKWQEEQKMVTDAIRQFPQEFGLRAVPGNVFRLSYTASYVNGAGEVMLYTQVRRESASGQVEWMDFAKGTIRELLAQVVPLS